MGAWGIHTFECDSSLDWIGDFKDDPSEAKILGAFTPQESNAAPGFLGRWFTKKKPVEPAELDGEDVLAAAEVVAALLGRPSPYAGEALVDLPSILLSPDTPSKAVSAVDAILERSNLKDCWVETDDYGAWVEDVREIQSRINQEVAE